MEENLQQYNQKRDFSKTGEPKGQPGSPARQLRFVVQHHIASRDHFDFRLEWDGALKSWAVPKGPSLNPADKRLAVRVEDHPLEYRDFEGTIPKGEYGGGTVMLWDEGAYEAIEFGENSIKAELKGERLKGRWALVRMKDKDKDSNWLLMKEKDGESKNEAGISQYETSVRTGRTMKQIAAGGEEKPTKNPFDNAEPQLAKLVGSVPRDGGWLYEIKFDGYRILAYIEGGRVRLASRNGGDYTQKFRAAADALAALAGNRAMVLDGEMVVLDQAGRSDFQALQSYIKNPTGASLHYMLFDLLALDGADLRGMPLLRRKETLAKLLVDASQMLRYSSHITDEGEALFREACCARLEGVIGKRADSVYSGARNGDWIKVKCGPRQEFVVGGCTVTEKRGEGVSALLLGVYREGALVYCGRAGGFSERDIRDLEQKFRPIESKESPFQNTPKLRKNETTVWLKPVLAAEIAFAEWTREGLLRQAKFKGLRTDKDIAQIVREDDNMNLDLKAAQPIKITSPEKIIIENPRTTKNDLALYYQQVAPRMLPHVSGRLLSAIRCPGGAEGECFYKKHPGAEGGGIVTMEVAKNDDQGVETYYYITDVFGLLSEAQMNTVEFHVWGSRAENLERPDVMVFDLDPDEGMALETVRQGVLDLKGILDELRLKSYLKTSGGKGYHVVVPFRPSAGWEAFRDFAKGVAQIMVAKWPERYTDNVRKVNRKGKIFVDYLRNTRGATSAAPYSVRRREGAPVSMPIGWNELGKVAPNGIDMAEALRRLKRKDPWEGFFEAEQGIANV